jgi:hypothetical protein
MWLAAAHAVPGLNRKRLCPFSAQVDQTGDNSWVSCGVSPLRKPAFCLGRALGLTRTQRSRQIGKPMLYQLSYSRELKVFKLLSVFSRFRLLPP